MPTSSDALAVIEMVPAMFAAETGEVRFTVGHVESFATVNMLELVAVPPAVVTPMNPVIAPTGTVAWIVVDEVTVKLALRPLKLTVLAAVKLVPLMVTPPPAGPLTGVKLVIVGGLTTIVKGLELVAMPPGVVTRIVPVVAAAGAVAWIDVAELTVNTALMPLKATAVAPMKFVPLIVTLVPADPFAGVKPVIVGGGGGAAFTNSNAPMS